MGIFQYFSRILFLLHSLRTPEIPAIVDAMGSYERDEFLDALPEETWQSLMKTLEEGRKQAAHPEESPTGTSELPAPALPHAELQPIIEARQIEKYYQQPEGREIQVVAPIVLSIVPNTIIALLGPSGSGKSTILRMLSGLSCSLKGRSSVARAAFAGIAA